MSVVTPLIDPRTAAELRDSLIAKLQANVPEWSLTNRSTGEADQLSAALIAVLGRFGEIVIQRLNQAPDKNFLAFLDLLGVSPNPPRPARVPLTFSLTPGSVTDAVVPAGTQAAAPPAEGEQDPVIFETEREFTAVAATLRALFAVDARRDLLADHGALLANPAPDGIRAFLGDRANEHVFYLGHDSYLAFPEISQLTLTFQMSANPPSAPDARVLQWELWDGVNGVPLAAVDTTQGLRASGTVTFSNLEQLPEQIVNGVRSRWLRCRLLTPVNPGTAPAQGMVRAAQLPSISSVKLSAVLNRSALTPSFAFAAGQTADVSKAFAPFGDRPKIGDTFYLGHDEAFSQPNSVVTLDVGMASPAPAAGGPPSSSLTLKWEAWTGTSWALLGVTTPTGSPGGAPLVDGTNAFTKSQSVRFTLPATLARTSINGVESYWVRVHIFAGNYGEDAKYVDKDGTGNFKLTPATFAPPLVGSLGLSYTVTTAQLAPDDIVIVNNEQTEEPSDGLTGGGSLAPATSGPFTPFIGFADESPAVYAAFALPPSRAQFPNRTVSLYHGVRFPPYGERAFPITPEFSVQPGTAGATVLHHYTLTNSTDGQLDCSFEVLGGAWASAVNPAQVSLIPGQSTDIKVTVTVPAAAQLPGVNASDRGFLKLRIATETGIHVYPFETRVGTVDAPTRDLRFEYWNGNAWTKLLAIDGTDRLTRAGVVEFLGPSDFASQRLFGVDGFWVRALFEVGDDPPVQLTSILPNTTFASQTVTLTDEVLGSSDASGGLTFKTSHAPVLAGAVLEVFEADGEWVSWIEVADFHGSGSEDRHYVLDHAIGEVLFGDGVHGRIPPRGTGNIRMARYQTGGGEIGNRASNTIVQLKTTVPYIDKVVNLEAAAGGVAAESTAALVARAPRILRHGGRAVALEDFEDLALLASPEVARAKCVPLRRLQDDPLGNLPQAGAVSVVIAPRSTDAKPVPSAELIAQVTDYLSANSTRTASIGVVGPLYVRVDVSVEVALVSLEGASAVEATVREELSRFLHPLTGGRDGTGWDFGRQPHLSDLHAAISDVAGVDHISRLTFVQTEELTGALNTGRFLVYSGEHEITLAFVGAE